MTANEGSKYAVNVNALQDQIEREVQREYVGYLPEKEVYDIFKAKLYVQPGIAYVTPEDVDKTLKSLVTAAQEVNDLYLSGKEYGSGTTKLKMKSTVLDTKRLLELIDRSKIGSKETFLEEVNENIVDFISRVNNDNDRKLLCMIFFKRDLLYKENIPALLKGSSLPRDALDTIISKEKEEVDVLQGARLVSPRKLATALPYSVYGKGEKPFE